MSEDTENPPVEESVGDRLRERGETVAVAESCTGGLVGSLLTDVPGSSDYFDRSVVTYSYDAKLEELGVNREALDEQGAVSEPVALGMARGVRDTAGTTWGVGTTGIAGPSGGTSEKPVGTAYVAVAYAGEWGSGESYATATREQCDGDRREIKEKVSRAALRMLRDEVARARSERTG